MPRAIGASTGVNETRTRPAATVARFCSISGVCRCTPPTPYAEAEPMVSAPSRCGLGDLAGSRRAGHGDHHEVVGVHQAGGDRGQQGQRRHRRVAAGHGDAVRAAQHVALARQLGQPVRPGAGVGAAVELLPDRRVLEPEVGAAVDDEHVVGQGRRDRCRVAVREGEEHDVVTGERFGVGGQQLAVGQRHQVRVVLAHRRPGAGAGGHRSDLEPGVAAEQPQQLAAGVPAGSRHCRAHLSTSLDWTPTRLHDYAKAGKYPVGGVE